MVLGHDCGSFAWECFDVSELLRLDFHIPVATGGVQFDCFVILLFCCTFTCVHTYTYG